LKTLSETAHHNADMPAHEHMKKWTPPETRLVIASVQEYGHQWNAIVKRLQERGYDRNVASVRNHYLRFLRGALSAGKNTCRYCGQKRAGHVCSAPTTSPDGTTPMRMAEQRGSIQSVPAAPANLSFLGAGNGAVVTGVVLADGVETHFDYSGLRIEQEAESTSQTVSEATSQTVAAINHDSDLEGIPKPVCESTIEEEASAMLSFAQKAVVTGFKSAAPLDGSELISPGITKAFEAPTALRLQQAEAEVEVRRAALTDALQRVSRISSLVHEPRSCSLVETSDAVEAAARELYNARERYVCSERARDYVRARVEQNAVEAMPRGSTTLAY